MNKVRVFTAEHNDPWFNLATEDWLFKNFPDDEHILFLWRNSPCIVIGRFQNPWIECDLGAMERDNIILSRRQSGGGAVYHDLGNTNFTFMSPIDDYDIQRNFSIILKAITHFGIEGMTSGRNDLLVEDKKFSGSAFKKNSKKAFHHGTLLINANMGALPLYLTPDKEKLVSKGIRSVSSRVTNLATIEPSITHEKLCEAIIEEFFNTYESRVEVEALTLSNLSLEPTLNETYTQYSSWQWLYGSSPHFTHPISKRFEWGRITFDFTVQKGLIKEVALSSDALAVEFIEFLQNILPQTPYTKQDIYSKIINLASIELGESLQSMALDVATLLYEECV
ncbi:MAG: lipoate--protein ligase [Spirochaetia bacterium]|nr:lipoate--protein ligase [Spirochaetia bacterium]